MFTDVTADATSQRDEQHGHLCALDLPWHLPSCQHDPVQIYHCDWGKAGGPPGSGQSETQRVWPDCGGAEESSAGRGGEAWLFSHFCAWTSDLCPQPCDREMHWGLQRQNVLLFNLCHYIICWVYRRHCRRPARRRYQRHKKMEMRSTAPLVKVHKTFFGFFFIHTCLSLRCICEIHSVDCGRKNNPWQQKHHLPLTGSLYSKIEWRSWVASHAQCVEHWVHLHMPVYHAFAVTCCFREVEVKLVFLSTHTCHCLVLCFCFVARGGCARCGWLRQRLHSFVSSPFFDFVIVLCVIANVIIMALEHYPMTLEFEVFYSMSELVSSITNSTQIIMPRHNSIVYYCQNFGYLSQIGVSFRSSCSSTQLRCWSKWWHWVHVTTSRWEIQATRWAQCRWPCCSHVDNILPLCRCGNRWAGIGMSASLSRRVYSSCSWATLNRCSQ